MTQLEILEAAVKALDLKKAEDIQVIGIKDLTIIADYFVIADGTSNTHTRALADEVEFQIGEKCGGLKPRQVQGNNGSNWIILDYSDIVIHIFSKEQREFYNLERLWSDGEHMDISKWIKPD
ncbi:MAG: ribosome silencing factor [Oscillospiraceae bacterium]|nr:ribosome silencing factor [Oscillospiraceae bacterium]